MRFTRLQSQFNIIKRFCHHNNISEQIPKNENIVSNFNNIDAKLNDINAKVKNMDAKLNDIDTKVKNIDGIIFSIFCIWNGVYFPIIIYLSY
jgi:tetrahydromethanopterin S-methyltransferase subunit G